MNRTWIMLVIVVSLAACGSPMVEPLATGDTIPLATAVARQSEVASATPAAAYDLVIAYWEPNGKPLAEPVSLDAAIPIGTQTGWVWVQLKGGGKVWIKQDDTVGKIPALPTREAVRIVYTPPTRVPRPPCLTSGTGDQIVTVCAWLDPDQLAAAAARKWGETYVGPPPVIRSPTPAPDFATTPPNVNPTAQRALIGGDPDALACDGSPICGGLTNREAAAELDKQATARAEKETP